MADYLKKNIKSILISIYIIIVLGFAAVAKSEPQIIHIPSAYQGEVVQTVDGKFYLVLNEKQYFELHSEVDLMPFSGWIVSVTGYESLHYKVGPEFIDLNSEVVDRNSSIPELLLLSINGISQHE